MCSLSPAAQGFEVLPAEVLQAEDEGFARHGLADDFGVLRQLVADGGADEVGPVGVEALVHQEVDLTEVDRAQVERELLGFAGHEYSLSFLRTSKDHPMGWYGDGQAGVKSRARMYDGGGTGSRGRRTRGGRGD